MAVAPPGSRSNHTSHHLTDKNGLASSVSSLSIRSDSPNHIDQIKEDYLLFLTDIQNNLISFLKNNDDSLKDSKSTYLETLNLELRSIIETISNVCLEDRDIPLPQPIRKTQSVVGMHVPSPENFFSDRHLKLSAVKKIIDSIFIHDLLPAIEKLRKDAINNSQYLQAHFWAALFSYLKGKGVDHNLIQEKRTQYISNVNEFTSVYIENFYVDMKKMLSYLGSVELSNEAIENFKSMNDFNKIPELHFAYIYKHQSKRPIQYWWELIKTNSHFDLLFKKVTHYFGYNFNELKLEFNGITALSFYVVRTNDLATLVDKNSNDYQLLYECIEKIIRRLERDSGFLPGPKMLQVINHNYLKNDTSMVFVEARQGFSEFPIAFCCADSGDGVNQHFSPNGIFVAKGLQDVGSSSVSIGSLMSAIVIREIKSDYDRSTKTVVFKTRSPDPRVMTKVFNGSLNLYKLFQFSQDIELIFNGGKCDDLTYQLFDFLQLIQPNLTKKYADFYRITSALSINNQARLYSKFIQLLSGKFHLDFKKDDSSIRESFKTEILSILNHESLFLVSHNIVDFFFSELLPDISKCYSEKNLFVSHYRLLALLDSILSIDVHEITTVKQIGDILGHYQELMSSSRFIDSANETDALKRLNEITAYLDVDKMQGKFNASYTDRRFINKLLELLNSILVAGRTYYSSDQKPSKIGWEFGFDYIRCLPPPNATEKKTTQILNEVASLKVVNSLSWLLSPFYWLFKRPFNDYSKYQLAVVISYSFNFSWLFPFMPLITPTDIDRMDQAIFTSGAFYKPNVEMPVLDLNLFEASFLNQKHIFSKTQSVNSIEHGVQLLFYIIFSLIKFAHDRTDSNVLFKSKFSKFDNQTELFRSQLNKLQLLDSKPSFSFLSVPSRIVNYCRQFLFPVNHQKPLPTLPIESIRVTGPREIRFRFKQDIAGNDPKFVSLRSISSYYELGVHSDFHALKGSTSDVIFGLPASYATCFTKKIEWLRDSAEMLWVIVHLRESSEFSDWAAVFPDYIKEDRWDFYKLKPLLDTACDEGYIDPIRELFKNLVDMPDIETITYEDYQLKLDSPQVNSMLYGLAKQLWKPGLLGSIYMIESIFQFIKYTFQMERKDPFILPQLTILESEAYQTFLLDKRTGSRRAMTYLSYFEDSRTKKFVYERFELKQPVDQAYDKNYNNKFFDWMRDFLKNHSADLMFTNMNLAIESGVSEYFRLKEINTPSKQIFLGLFESLVQVNDQLKVLYDQLLDSEDELNLLKKKQKVEAFCNGIPPDLVQILKDTFIYQMEMDDNVS
tara:strand:+ start:822 stop:4709 length:3888 start_codon:yes stop_codon:yes gene_type:complete